MHCCVCRNVTTVSHQEYSYCGAQCQQGSWCSQGWMGCNHPTTGTPWGCLYVVAQGQQAKLGTRKYIKDVLRSVYLNAKSLFLK